MGARVLLVVGALEAIAACGGGFSSEAPPVDPAADAGDDVADAGAPDVTTTDASTCTGIDAGLVKAFDTDAGPTLIKTDGTSLYWVGGQTVELASLSDGTVDRFNALGNIEQFAISTDAMFYRIGGMIFYRPKSQFAGNGACGGCDFGSNNSQLLGNGLSQTVVIADNNDVFLVSNPGTKAYIAHAFSPNLAAVSPALAVVAGTAVGSTGVQVFTVPDAGPIDIQPLRLATNGDSIFYAKSNGDLVALEVATRKERVLATGQPSPIGELVVTSTHLWFNTPAGVRRARLSDACVQTITDTATTSFAVAGTKVYVVGPGVGRVSVVDVPN